MCVSFRFPLDPGIDQLKPTFASLDLDEVQPTKRSIGPQPHKPALVLKSAPVGRKRSCKEHPFSISAEMQCILNVEYIDYELGSLLRHSPNARGHV
jgi:hypothetical protein